MIVPPKTTKVLFDTNVLLLFGLRHLDLFAEASAILQEPLELVVPEQVLGELERLAGTGTKEGRAAKLAVILVRQRSEDGPGAPPSPSGRCAKKIPLKIGHGSKAKHADDAIVEIAEDDVEHTVVCTLDRKLRRRLLERTVRVIGVSQRGLSLHG
jgi:rRNA-processing protein FCF1